MCSGVTPSSGGPARSTSNSADAAQGEGGRADAAPEQRMACSFRVGPGEAGRLTGGRPGSGSGSLCSPMTRLRIDSHHPMAAPGRAGEADVSALCMSGAVSRPRDTSADPDEEPGTAGRVSQVDPPAVRRMRPKDGSRPRRESPVSTGAGESTLSPSNGIRRRRRCYWKISRPDHRRLRNTTVPGRLADRHGEVVSGRRGLRSNSCSAPPRDLRVGALQKARAT